MQCSRPLESGCPVVAVIGGGASGTLAAVHLLRLAAPAGAELRVLLIDRDGRHGLGRAYSTTHPDHLLNSPAETMSAVSGDSTHLTRWARAAGIAPSGFLARRDYGRYLRDLLTGAERNAQSVVRLSRVSAEVVAVRQVAAKRPLRLRLGNGGLIDADYAVLATGNLPPQAPCPVPRDRYIADPWAPGALDGVADGSPVIVLGTGLTMIDVAIAVTDADPRATVHAVSRRALLPREHQSRPGPDWPAWRPSRALTESGEPLRLAELVRYVRTAAEAHPGGWADVVDGMRPYIPGLWQRLPDEDKDLFLSRYARYWEVHRHRVPPASARRVAELRRAGRLRLLRGRVSSVRDIRGSVVARLDADGARTEIRAGWLVNGIGPAADVASAADPLLRDLIACGLARPDEVRLGLDADASGAIIDASGNPSDRLFTLGPPLRGSRYETTAIPEIRDQAAAVARRLISVSSPAQRAGSAA